MKSLMLVGTKQMFRGVRRGRGLDAGIGAAIFLFGLLRKYSGKREKLYSGRLTPDQELTVRIDRLDQSRKSE